MPSAEAIAVATKLTEQNKLRSNESTNAQIKASSFAKLTDAVRLLNKIYITYRISTNSRKHSSTSRKPIVAEIKLNQEDVIGASKNAPNISSSPDMIVNKNVDKVNMIKEGVTTPVTTLYKSIAAKAILKKENTSQHSAIINASMKLLPSTKTSEVTLNANNTSQHSEIVKASIKLLTSSKSN